MTYKQNDRFFRKSSDIPNGNDFEWKSFEIKKISEKSVKVFGLLSNNLKAERKILLGDFDLFLTNYQLITTYNK